MTGAPTRRGCGRPHDSEVANLMAVVLSREYTAEDQRKFRTRQRKTGHTDPKISLLVPVPGFAIGRTIEAWNISNQRISTLRTQNTICLRKGRSERFWAFLWRL
jgi:hypothetical protein